MDPPSHCSIGLDRRPYRRNTYAFLARVHPLRARMARHSWDLTKGPGDRPHPSLLAQRVGVRPFLNFSSFDFNLSTRSLCHVHR